jgi:hypothetical protein
MEERKNPCFILFLNERNINKINDISRISFEWGSLKSFYLPDKRQYKIYLDELSNYENPIIDELKNNKYKFDYGGNLVLSDKNEKENNNNNTISDIIDKIKKEYSNIKFIFTSKNRNILNLIYNDIKEKEKLDNFEDFIKKYYFVVLEITDKNLYYVNDPNIINKNWYIKEFLNYIEILENSEYKSLDINILINKEDYKKYKDNLFIVFRKCNDPTKITKILYFTNSRLSRLLREENDNYEYKSNLIENDKRNYYDNSLFKEDNNKILYDFTNSHFIKEILEVNNGNYINIDYIHNDITITEKKYDKDTLYQVSKTHWINNNWTPDIIICDWYFSILIEQIMKKNNKVNFKIDYTKKKLSKKISLIESSYVFEDQIKVILSYITDASLFSNAVLIGNYEIDSTILTIEKVIKEILELKKEKNNIARFTIKNLIYIDTNEQLSLVDGPYDGSDLYTYCENYVSDRNEEILEEIKTTLIPNISKENIKLEIGNIFCYHDSLFKKTIIFDSLQKY